MLLKKNSEVGFIQGRGLVQWGSEVGERDWAGLGRF